MYERIKSLREDCDFTQQQLAEVLNISQATYSRYESGTLDIPTWMLIVLARLYKTNVDYLLGKTNERTPYPAPKRKHGKNAPP